MRTRHRHLTLGALGAVGAALLLTAAPLAPAADPKPPTGSSSVLKLARTDRGVWDGTWLHVSRDFRMVVWMRTRDGLPEARLQYLGTKVPPEKFSTDWTGQASYRSRKSEGAFSLTFSERDENAAVGDWRWLVDYGDSSHEDVGHFTLYRGGDGRSMVFDFDQFEQIQRRPQRTDHIPFQNALLFRKVSKRLVEWDAIPL